MHWVFMLSFVTLEVSYATASGVLVQAGFSNFPRILLWHFNIPISVYSHYKGCDLFVFKYFTFGTGFAGDLTSDLVCWRMKFPALFSG